jgi:hypothetical protein
MGSLASTYCSLGEFSKAEELDTAMLEQQKEILGNDHQDTLFTMSNLALKYNSLGEFQNDPGYHYPINATKAPLLKENRT